MKKIISLSESDLHNIVKNLSRKIMMYETAKRKLRSDEKSYTVPDMFDSTYDDVTITRKKKVSKGQREANAQQKKEEKAKQKKIKQDKDFDEKWAKKGYRQGNLFDESIHRAIKNALNEIHPFTAKNYQIGRMQQANGERPISDAMKNKYGNDFQSAMRQKTYDSAENGDIQKAWNNTYGGRMKDGTSVRMTRNRIPRFRKDSSYDVHVSRPNNDGSLDSAHYYSNNDVYRTFHSNNINHPQAVNSDDYINHQNDFVNNNPNSYEGFKVANKLANNNGKPFDDYKNGKWNV